MDDRQLFAIVARKVPTIWNAVGPASLNPQPLPPLPVFVDPLNPQPLPPGPPPELYGVEVGRELLKLSWQADKLGTPLSTASTWADNPAPGTYGAPSMPPWLPRVVEPNAAWLEGYYLGLACVLAVAPEPETEAEFTAQLFTQAVAALAAIPAPGSPTGGSPTPGTPAAG